MTSYVSLVSKSRYDLPIEFHAKDIETLDEADDELAAHISRSVADAYGSIIQTFSRASSRLGSVAFHQHPHRPRRSRFQHLKPEILIDCLKSQKSFEFVRDEAIQVIICSARQAVAVLHQRLKCEIDKLDKEEIPHRMFSWSMDDFKERRKIKNLVWLELIRKQTPPDCLENKKVLFDLTEMLRYLESILKVFQNRKDDHAREKAILAVRDARSLLTIEEDMLEELARNTEAVRKYLNDLLAMALSKATDDTRRKMLVDLEQRIMNHDVWDPIEMRYQMKYYGLIVDQVQIKIHNRENFYETEIRRYHNETKREAHCSQCTMDAMYADIERFKTYIDEYSAKYKQEFESIDSKISYKKTSMDKLKASRKYLEEQILRFHEELELIRLAELAKQQRQLEAEQKRLEELAEQAAKKAAKKGKKGGKKGKK